MVRVPEAPAAPGPAGPLRARRSGRPRRGMTLGIQRGAGNQAAVMAARSMLARQPAPAPAPPVPAPAPGVTPPGPAPDPAAELKKAEDFVKGGPYKAEVTPGGRVPRPASRRTTTRPRAR